jgi:antimicrobial peptide resistance and lipid A acylation protein PagP
MVTLALLVTGASITTGTAQAQADWDVVLNGRAVHLDAQKPWNEDNWGLGIEREFNPAGRWVKVALANGFKDSLGQPSYMAGGGIKRRFRVVSDDFYVDVGVIGFLMTREDVQHNQPFPGALPAMTVGGKRVALNITYLPGSVVDHVTNSKLRDPNMDGVLFLQLKLDASLFGFRGRRGQMFADGSEE